MSEFARKWDASTLEDFYKFDANQDGFITLQECLAGVKKGYLKGSSSSSSSSTASSGNSSSGEASSTASSDGATIVAAPTTPSTSTSTAKGNNDAMKEWAKKRMSSADKDKNGFLTPDEFKSTDAKFADVDKNKDGQIDLEEYAVYRSSR